MLEKSFKKCRGKPVKMHAKNTMQDLTNNLLFYCDPLLLSLRKYPEKSIPLSEKATSQCRNKK